MPITTESARLVIHSLKKISQSFEGRFNPFALMTLTPTLFNAIQTIAKNKDMITKEIEMFDTKAASNVFNNLLDYAGTEFEFKKPTSDVDINATLQVIEQIFEVIDETLPYIEDGVQLSDIAVLGEIADNIYAIVLSASEAGTELSDLNVWEIGTIINRILEKIAEM